MKPFIIIDIANEKIELFTDIELFFEKFQIEYFEDKELEDIDKYELSSVEIINPLNACFDPLVFL